MTRASLREYAGVQRERYLHAPRAEKHRLLNEVVAVAGLHRKAAIRLLRRAPGPTVRRPRAGRPRQYGPAVATATKLLSEATGHIGPHRWHPFLPELLDRLTQSGDLVVTPDVDKHLRQVSPATLARLLVSFRPTLPHRGLTTTRPGTWLKHEIPVRTFADWSDAQPGFLELDLVADCGPTTRGFFLYTLCAVDVATNWSTSKPCGARASSGYAPLSTTSANACRSRCAGGQRQWLGVHQPRPVCLVPARGDHLHPQPPLPEERLCPCRAEERRHRPPRSSAMIAMPPRPPMPSALACMIWRACTSTSSSRSSSSSARSAAARACIACTTARRPRTSGCARQACSPPIVGRSSRRCISV